MVSKGGKLQYFIITILEIGKKSIFLHNANVVSTIAYKKRRFIQAKKNNSANF